MFSLRQVVNHGKRALSLRPMSASAGPLVDVAVDNDGVALVTLQRAPVNSLNLDLLQAINKALDDVVKNKSRAMILTSASPTVFSAGLDIMEMYKPDMKRAEQFWSTLQEVWMKLYGLPLITAAAINGHAPAGGCLLAVSCEYRAMVGGKFRIGLNETALGIVAPNWFQESLMNTIPHRQAELALTLGKLFPVDEALKVGLVDDVATDKADAIAKCKAFIEKFDNIPPMARTVTKQKIRQGPIQRLAKNRQADIQEFLGFLKNENVQQGLEMYLTMLKMKAAK